LGFLSRNDRSFLSVHQGKKSKSGPRGCKGWHSAQTTIRKSLNADASGPSGVREKSIGGDQSFLAIGSRGGHAEKKGGRRKKGDSLLKVKSDAIGFPSRRKKTKFNTTERHTAGRKINRWKSFHYQVFRRGRGGEIVEVVRVGGESLPGKKR